jgi:hypothetical protein
MTALSRVRSTLDAKLVEFFRFRTVESPPALGFPRTPRCTLRSARPNPLQHAVGYVFAARTVYPYRTTPSTTF